MATAIHVLRILSPVTILSLFFTSSLWDTFTAKEKEPAADQKDASTDTSSDQQESTNTTETPSTPTRAKLRHRSLQLILITIVGFLYIGESSVLAIHSNPDYNPGSVDENLAFTLFASLTWFILFLGLFDLEISSSCHSFQQTWILAALFEICLLVMSIVDQESSSHAVRITQLVLQFLRVFFQISLITTKYIQPFTQEHGSDEEVAPLLLDAENIVHKNEKEADNQMSLQRLCKNWWIYVKGFKLFLPIIWPQNIRLHLQLLVVVVCILAERIINVALPISLGNIITHLGRLQMPWIPILIFMVLRFLDSNAGVSLVRSVAWYPIELSAAVGIKRAAYNHLMSLSCDFHDNMKSDVTLQTIYRGTQITDLLETVLFELLPMVADLVISISVFWVLFDTYTAFTVAVVVVLYLWSTIKGLAIRIRIHREFIQVWEAEWYAMAESVKCWDAVTHFVRILHEMNNYRDKTSDTRKITLNLMLLAQFLSGLRSAVLLGGLFIGCCLVAHRVAEGVQDVGNFVVFVSYWAQLSVPLSFFAHSFQRISKQLVDAEKLLQIFEKQPTIQCKDEAEPFVLKDGTVEFKSVSFTYDGKRKVTDDISFYAEPGKVIAFVGETGCGKSTLFKLLFRFYDPTEGSILIDGQNIKDITLDFREHIGIVPQDPALFNKSIRETLRYANLDSTDEQIEEACKAVALHDKIMTFTKCYDEVIGERGTKLSGGEKQRVAIARAILKNPRILLLDEATSSVDSTTEAQIQASLHSLCINRTTFVIAHRLSTIVNADQVVVMENGKIVESGTHASLIKQRGPYQKLWKGQLGVHVEELRGESRSRSREPKKKDTLLVNDINSDVEEAKKLLDHTVVDERIVLNGNRAHVASHENHTAGRAPANDDNSASQDAPTTIGLARKGFKLNARRKQSATEPLSHGLAHDSEIGNDEIVQNYSRIENKPGGTGRTVSAMAKPNAESSSGESSKDAPESRGSKGASEKISGRSHGRRDRSSRGRGGRDKSRDKRRDHVYGSWASNTTNGSGQLASEESQLHTPLLKVPANSPVQGVGKDGENASEDVGAASATVQGLEQDATKSLL